jgi:hypothetical protein
MGTAIDDKVESNPDQEGIHWKRNWKQVTQN